MRGGNGIEGRFSRVEGVLAGGGESPRGVRCEWRGVAVLGAAWQKILKK